ncbi:MAG: hypothetical protein RLZZ488_145 [Pseudomonadota bacterium]
MLRTLIKRIALLSLCLVSAELANQTLNAASADANPDVPAHQKRETELRLGLTEEGFNILFNRWCAHLEASRRTDSYFDVFEGEQFLFRRQEPRAKLRIQTRDKELVAQKSWVIESHTTQSSGFLWSATTRTAASEKHPLGGKTHARLSSTLQLLDDATQNVAKPDGLTAQLQMLWSVQSWPAHADFDDGTRHLRGPLVPAAVVSKERWLIPVTLPDGRTGQLQLGRDYDELTADRSVSFELELELKNTSVADEQATLTTVSRFLLLQGLRPQNTTSQKTNDFFRTLENLYSQAGDSLVNPSSL